MFINAFSLSFYPKTIPIDTGKAILFGLAGLVGYELLSKASAAGTLTFYPGQLHSLDFDGATPIITVQLLAQNTSNKQFTMQSLAGNVFTENYLVGNISSFNPVTIAPNKQTIIPLRIRLSLIGIVNQIIDAIQTHNFQMTLQVESYVNVDGIQQPLNLNFKVGG